MAESSPGGLEAALPALIEPIPEAASSSVQDRRLALLNWLRSLRGRCCKSISARCCQVMRSLLGVILLSSGAALIVTGDGSLYNTAYGLVVFIVGGYVSMATTSLRQEPTRAHLHDTGVRETAVREAIRKFPRLAVSSESLKAVVEEKRSCPVCLTLYNIGDDQLLLPCFHVFHYNCVDPWLQDQGTCPICRRDVVEESTNASEFTATNASEFTASNAFASSYDDASAGNAAAHAH